MPINNNKIKANITDAKANSKNIPKDILSLYQVAKIDINVIAPFSLIKKFNLSNEITCHEFF